jgi:hypothetical protein
MQLTKYKVRFYHEVIGGGVDEIEGESYDHAAEILKRRLKAQFPTALLRILSEQPIELSDTEKAAQEEGS